MRTALTLLSILLAAACAQPPTGQSTVESLPALLDVSLDVGPDARVQPGFGVWRVEMTGPVAHLAKYQPAGDAAGIDTNIIIDLAMPPALVDAYETSMDAGTRESLNVSELILNNSDPDGLISGRLVVADRLDIDFWVDVDPTTVIEPDPDVPFEMAPGSVIEGSSFALQYVGVLEDSRCPADATCIWEGAVSVEFARVDGGGRTTLTASGLATPNGPVNGTNPAVALDDASYLEVLDVTEGNVRVVVRMVND